MEFVLVVKRYDLFDLSFPHGFVSKATESETVRRYLERIREKAFFLERRAAEEDSSFKQIIPYCLVSVEAERFILVQRLSKQGESRLHNKLSIGIGGHINPVDDEGDHLEMGCRRELGEELEFSAPFDAEVVGVINDESQDVGSVHFGVAFHVRFPNDEVRIRERDRAVGELVDRETLLKKFADDGDQFESWSSLMLERFDEVVADPASVRS